MRRLSSVPCPHSARSNGGRYGQDLDVRQVQESGVHFSFFRSLRQAGCSAATLRSLCKPVQQQECFCVPLAEGNTDVARGGLVVGAAAHNLLESQGLSWQLEEISERWV